VDNPAAVSGSAPVRDGSDEIGRVEAHGIHYVPEGDRHSRPSDLAWAMFGPQFGFGNMVFGSGTGNVALSIAMLVVSLLSFVLAIYSSRAAGWPRSSAPSRCSPRRASSPGRSPVK
jgi:hypothetical protein